jgi:heme/copper-type cytochrome/quinol oxidase subunit 2
VNPFSTLAWSGWWLPSNHSVHGGAIDNLFLWIFWITMITFVLVQVTLVWFLIRYRGGRKPGKAIFTHGHTRLEMAWTIAPALILAGLAIGSKGVWEDYRYLDPDGPEPARVMVIGEQFQWNVIYPGPDNQLGRYLAYPRPTDLTWPAPPGEQVSFAGVPGPAHLPREQAIGAINTYIVQQNRLGKDLSDPPGMDDNWQGPLGEVVVPVNRPIEVHLSSKDVIHSFFLPNFRVKLDAVPGMRGIVRFTATQTSAEREAESRRVYTTEELARLVQSQNLIAVVTEEDEIRGAEHHRPRRGPAFWRYADAEGQTIIRHGLPLTAESVERLQQAGVQEIVAHLPGYFDLVCAELCGLGHSRMQGRLVVIDQDEYDRRFLGRE